MKWALHDAGDRYTARDGADAGAADRDAPFISGRVRDSASGPRATWIRLCGDALSGKSPVGIHFCFGVRLVGDERVMHA